jgi:CheY-like chemotaxis protein
VRDTGIGIPKNKQEGIFRAFEQEDTSTTRKYGGTGLGLTIASRLVALMDGQITVDSEVGRGSTFAFTARFGLQPHPTEPKAAPPPVLLHNLPVLIVDDNATNRHILRQWLRGWQMDPATASDPMTAMDALWNAVNRGQPYALVLLDSRMPQTDGLALAAQIRKRAELSATRIILLTSGERPADSDRTRDLRIDAHLLKPVQEDELLETIFRVIRRAKEGTMKDEKSSRVPIPSLTPHPSSLRILVAEDNEFNAQLLEQLLVRRGHQVRLARDGREALAEAKEGGVDLLFLDIHMPELDGFQVVEAIRRHEQAAGGHLPVVALTARARKEDREQCLAAGMDDFLAKPIHATSLWTAIDRVLRKAEPGRMKDEGPTSATSDSSLIPHPSSFGQRLLDPQVLLAACGNDHAILERICHTLRSRLPHHLAAVQESLRDQDARSLREAAHKLAGMVAAFSTMAGRLASELEDYAAQDQLSRARPLVARLETISQDLLRAVEDLSLERLQQWARPADAPS